jgi:hypothetical protein
LLVKRPSRISADRILRSIKSRRLFFAADGFADGVRPIGFSLSASLAGASPASVHNLLAPFFKVLLRRGKRIRFARRNSTG